MKKPSVTKKIVLSIVAVAVVVLLINFLFLPLSGNHSRTNAPIATGNDYIVNHDGKTSLISAHRAGGDLAPEETLKAFELCMTATNYKVDIVEFDLHMTKDEKLVLLHDDTVNRTSNATEQFGNKKVKVKDKTLAELKELNFGENFQAIDGSYPYRGLRGDDIPEEVKILTLDEILTYLTGVRPNLNYIIEIKDGGKIGEKATDILCETIERYGITKQVILGTFKANVTKHMTKNYSHIARSASIREVFDFYYAFLYGVKNVKTNFSVLQIPVGGKGIYDLSTKAFVEYAHAHGIAVQYWTINDKDEIDRLIKNGADAIITDNPEVAHGVLNSAK